jgi:hypothetical protein
MVVAILLFLILVRSFDEEDDLQFLDIENVIAYDQVLEGSYVDTNTVTGSDSDSDSDYDSNESFVGPVPLTDVDSSDESAESTNIESSLHSTSSFPVQTTIQSEVTMLPTVTASPVVLPEASDLIPNATVNAIPKPNTDLDGSKSDSKMNSAVLAGIVIGTIVFIVLLGGMVFYMVKKKKRREAESSVYSEPTEFSSSDGQTEEI